MATASPIGAQRFRDLMAGVCAPVTVVTSSAGGRPHGATVSSLASLSLEPPLVTVALDRRSTLLDSIIKAGRFGVNLLGHDQGELAMLFARRDADRFAGTSWYEDEGLPRLDGAAGWIACGLNRAVADGDHMLLIGLVTRASSRTLPPLIYAHRTFGTHSRFAQRAVPLIVSHIAACSS